MMTRRQFNITDARHGAALTVRIVPKANRTEIVGIEEDGTLKVRLMAPPIAGQANEELIAFLADFLGVNPADVEIVAGLDSRKKLISVMNVRADEIERLIAERVPRLSDSNDV